MERAWNWGNEGSPQRGPRNVAPAAEKGASPQSRLQRSHQTGAQVCTAGNVRPCMDVGIYELLRRQFGCRRVGYQVQESGIGDGFQKSHR